MAQKNTNGSYIYAKRELDLNETAKVSSDLQNYYSELVKDKSGFNRYFIGLEQNLEFLGIIDFEVKLKPHSKDFISNCKLASLKTHMLSGDCKKKCLNVGRRVGLIDKDVGYCDFKFLDETDAVSTIKGMLQEVKNYMDSEKRDYLKEFRTLLDGEKNSTPVIKKSGSLGSMVSKMGHAPQENSDKIPCENKRQSIHSKFDRGNDTDPIFKIGASRQWEKSFYYAPKDPSYIKQNTQGQDFRKSNFSNTGLRESALLG